MLCCRRNVEAKSSAYYGSGSGEILLGNLNCNGKEASIQACSGTKHPGGCSHYEDAGISCSNGNSLTYIGIASKGLSCHICNFTRGITNIVYLFS